MKSTRQSYYFKAVSLGKLTTLCLLGGKKPILQGCCIDKKQYLKNGIMFIWM